MDTHIPRADERTLQAQVQELMCFIWDNYLQICDNIEDIFLMGVGSAYLGIKVLLINRGGCIKPTGELRADRPKDVKSRISGVVNFVNGNLRPIKSDVDQDLSPWYKENSRVYVASNHACWSDSELTRKVMKRRFGTVIKSSASTLSGMMSEHYQDVREWILERASEDQQAESTEDENRMA